jgi:hypothetical protein
MTGDLQDRLHRCRLTLNGQKQDELETVSAVRSEFNLTLTFEYELNLIYG